MPASTTATPDAAKLIDGGRADPQTQIARREPWHRGDRSGALRAGVSDTDAAALPRDLHEALGRIHHDPAAH